MIKAILQRPISVLMLFLACVILGIITYNTLPVSLLPDIAIPEITVQVSDDNTSARELENTVVKPVRRQLMQVGKLRDIQSETRDGSAIIRLKFDYGTDTDLAFIEVNEKIDAAMNNLPRESRRPRVIKASATDLPVFYLNLTLKSDIPYSTTNEQQFLELSEFADNVVKRRIEQLTEVAMADMTGLMYKHLQIVPDPALLESASITLSDIENVLSANNIEPGSMIVRDGYYEYNIKFSSLLRTPEDVRNIFIEKNGRLFQLKDLAMIDVVRQPESGMSLINGKRAVTLGVIKQADETMKNLRKSLDETMENLQRSYPDVEFTINRNQTELLDYTISNLQENLILGFILVFLVALLFLGDGKSPLIIGISMTTALITTFIFFFLFRQSMNIITLSGLILALGNMIDSSIVVTDIITQYRKQGYGLDDACEKGTKEVIMPIFSSTLTTISVFAPLIFMSGIAGALFTAEAFAVTIGMLVSYLTGIILLPVLYKIAYGERFANKNIDGFFAVAQRKIDAVIFPAYDKGIHYVFNHKIFFILLLFIAVPLCAVLFRAMPKTSMPNISYVESIVTVEWNENIHVDENAHRIAELLQTTEGEALENAAYVGQRQYLLDKDNDLTATEAQLYLKADKPSRIASLETRIAEWVRHNYPNAVVTFSPPENIFEKIFDTGDAEVVVQLYPKNREEIPDPAAIRQMETILATSTGEKAENVPFEQQFVITPDKEKLLLYGVSQQEVSKTLKTAFRDNQVAILRSFQQYLPISIAGKQQSIQDVLQKTLVYGYPVSDRSQAIRIPLAALVDLSPSEDIKTIIAGKNGEYIPIYYYHTGQPEKLMEKVSETVKQDNSWDITFSGNFFSNRQMLKELIIILLISILLMYFILASQFENFLQPLIVLMEIPIDIAFTLVVLWLTGHTLNLMSAIGIVVTIGVILTDSILKIDLINELRKGGMPLMEAIHTGGVRRLRAIIMTALTSLFSMIPILFTFDMGSELQKPLAIAMISAMSIGTVVSIFLIPLLYWTIYRKKDGLINNVPM
ncbi:efflux RND transporter permease subunit [Proteiniphilum sp.]|uniref:efflux RND transporter permease subunit n=1 Tax=Proteiniphilum sp. TaxID=1926877 RepID=UPI002B21AF2F|nr:efflux RND transporter permease subunit [Proteiniphilum sp.]MEA4918094.1 efflux RND transporter permease subunit [Proteiniphilum sp.]